MIDPHYANAYLKYMKLKKKGKLKVKIRKVGNSLVLTIPSAVRELMDLKEDGSFKMNMKYFDYCAGLRMTSKNFHKLFGGPPREPESKLTQRDMDLARSVQEVTEEIVMRMARHVHKETGQKYLCLAS